MGIAAPAIVPIVSSLQFHNLLQNSMSQDYHQGVFSFSNGFERSQPQEQPQIRRDKLRVPGFDAVGIEEESSAGLPVYESAGMLSEMFNYPPATELLENQILQSYRNSRAAADWFLHRQGMVVGGGGDLPDSKNHQDQQQQISGINGDSAAAMQLFLTNPQHQHQTSPSPSPSSHPPPAAAASTSSTLHMLLPNPPSSGGGFGQFPWVNVPSENPGVVEGQGLSLSLSSSLQHLDATKAEEFRIGEGEMLYFGGGNAGALSFQGGVGHHNHHQLAAAAPGIGSPYGTAAVSMVRNSKYAKAAQELLEEFCCVGRGQLRKNKFSKQNNNTRNPNSNTTAGAATSGGGDGGASSSKDILPLSGADRLENQRRKVKLLSMLDEVDRRYSHYCEQMQMVVNSFDMLMGYGAAAPYTSLAQKAMSRHFRCLKDAVTAQLKQTCELLGEKDTTASSGVTKGETPRLRILDQSLRQQRAFHQMGMMEQEAWRPQRGLPERSVNILRAWLFEHFLHPYPSDADKHLLARQTGLSRNQVSNWFINARVRLWKPMVEDMYQQEAKEDSSSSAAAAAGEDDQTTTTAQTPASTVAVTGVPAPEIINAPGNYTVAAAARTMDQEETVMESAAMMRFGPSSGDVSLTLGLRHAGNLPEKGSFSVRDFGGF